MVEETFIEPMDPIERFNRLADLLTLNRAVRRGYFDGTVYQHALPYFEAFYRWVTVGQVRSDEEQVRRSLERGIHDIWPQNIPVRQAIMQVVADVVADTAKISYPISEWTIEELKSEYIRLDAWKDVYDIIAGGAGVIGTADLAATIAVKAGIQGAQKLAAVIGPAGFAVSVASTLIALVAARQCSAIMAEIEEEIQDVRIGRGEINEEEWNSIFREQRQD